MSDAIGTSRSYTEEPGADFWGGLLVALGLAGVVVASLLFGMAGPDAVLPSGHANLTIAFAGAQAAPLTIRAAGLVGMISDVALVAGALILSMGLSRLRGTGAAGWAMIVACGAVFIIVDTLAAFVLVGTAVDPIAQPGFGTAKLLFDGLFLIGTLASGAGAMLIYWPLFTSAERTIPRWLAGAGLVAGLAAIAGAVGCLAGAPFGLLTGLSIMGGSAITALFAAMVAKRGWRIA